MRSADQERFWPVLIAVIDPAAGHNSHGASARATRLARHRGSRSVSL